MNRKAACNTLMTALGLAAAAGIVVLAAPESASGRSNQESFDSLPTELVLAGVVRDFKERSVQGGHPDFERQPAGGFGHYMNNVEMNLDSDGKPVFKGAGRKVSSQWRDSSGRPIHPSLVNASNGDTAGSYTGNPDNGGIQSAESFRSWFRDTPGMNMSAPLSITLKRAQGSNVYIFDDRQDPEYSNRGGFFPINSDLFGNSANNNKNYHFTYELATEFIYRPGQGQVFTFRGDDDVWVFVNGRLVIDIGGVHSAVEQTVALDRLDNLRPNQRNTLHFFFAERHRTMANFRIETTINLRTAELPNTSKLYD